MRQASTSIALILTLVACSSDPSAGASAAATATTDGGAPATDVGARRPLAAIWGTPTLADENPDPEIVEVHLRAAPFRTAFDGKETDVLAYNGSVPGPILQARPKQRVIVHFENALAEATTVHWHGLRIPESMDGSPRIQSPVPAGGSFTYDFVVPDSGSFWYHPHVRTHDQLERGLYGAIVIQADEDPLYDLERYLVLDDIKLDEAGAIVPAKLDGFDGFTGRYGNMLLTNGKSAKLATDTSRKGRVERWRLVNTANARMMMLRVQGARVRLIGTDGGLLGAPVDVTGDLTLPVGGRLDLEVSYDRAGDAKLVLADASSPTTMFAVTVADGPDAPRAITWPSVTPAIAERPAMQSFDMTFDYVQQGTSAAWYVNGESHPADPLLTVNEGATVKIRLANATGGMAHPFHLHGQFFRVLDDKWPGLRDSVMVPAIGPIEIIAYFDNPGRWMAHCHILEHVELGMMADIEVLKTGAAPGTSGMHSH